MTAREDNLRLHLEELARGAIRLESLPLTLQVEPTSVCNLHCTMCGRESWDPEKNPAGEMAPWVLDAIRPMLPSLLELVIGGYAEPTLARMLQPILAAARDAGCPARLITNGTRLDDRLATELVDLRLAHLVLSVDGGREPTMRRIRGVGLEETLAGLDRVTSAARRLGRPAPRFQISFTAMRSNVGELADLVRAAAAHGVAEVAVGHLKIYSEPLLDESLFLMRAEAEAAFARASEAAGAAGVTLLLPTFDRRDADCLMPFRMLFVKWNGKVLGCCSAVFENDRHSFPVGDLRDADLASIWNGRAIASYRRAMRGEGEYPEPCRGCAFRHDTFEAHRRTP